MAPYNDLSREVIITSIREETPGVKTFSIRPTDNKPLPYIAGQFITFAFTHHGKEERRSFSISSSPVFDEPLSFTVKRVDNGAYSRLLIDRAKEGDVLYTTGAAGLFTLPVHDTYEQVAFFAAGIGITPAYSIIRTMLQTQPDKQIVLVYSNRAKEDTVFYNELTALAVKYPQTFRVEFLFSTGFDLARARLSKSLVSVLLNEFAAVSKDKMLFFICGPFSYMRMVTYALEEYGIDDNSIRKENFNTNDREVMKADPPDKATHNVTLRFRGQVHIFPVTYPDTILQAAKAYGLSLPYSCEVGRCGSCAAICTSGKVWLSYNEVLMDTELKHGGILTCVGHPVNGDVTIDA